MATDPEDRASNKRRSRLRLFTLIFLILVCIVLFLFVPLFPSNRLEVGSLGWWYVQGPLTAGDSSSRAFTQTSVTPGTLP
jgi:hypothetical protein